MDKLEMIGIALLDFARNYKTNELLYSNHLVLGIELKTRAKNLLEKLGYHKPKEKPPSSPVGYV